MNKLMALSLALSLTVSPLNCKLMALSLALGLTVSPLNCKLMALSLAWGSTSFAPPWLWIIASSWLLALLRYFETHLLEILLSGDYSIATLAVRVILSFLTLQFNNKKTPDMHV